MTTDYVLGFLTGLGAGLVAYAFLADRPGAGALLQVAGFALLLVGGLATSVLRLRRHYRKPEA